MRRPTQPYTVRNTTVPVGVGFGEDAGASPLEEIVHCIHVCAPPGTFLTVGATSVILAYTLCVVCRARCRPACTSVLFGLCPSDM